MGDVSEAILRCLLEKDPIDSLNLSKILKEDHQKIIGSIKSLQAIGNVIESEQQSTKCWELTPEGKEVALNGSHEALVYKAVPENGISQSELMKIVPNAKVGFSKAMSAGWIQIDKSTNDGPKVLRKVDVIEDFVQKYLLNVENNRIDEVAENQRQELKKRKLLQEILIKSYLIKKGKEFTTTVSKPETDITPEMIASQSWKDKKFKEYNFDALGVPPDCGHLHPLMKVRAEFRQIFLEMGFTEMQTNNFIESSFWNFDALYQPQQHPARDAHDTFFISKPLKATQFPMDYLERVKTVHEVGGYGSEGYKYTWKFEEAEKNLLRTHTTAASARILYKLAQEEEFKAGKYFSIDRVFRNETLDATHLAEFHQIEGVIVDRDLTLGDLIGILYEFFKKLGITKLRFKPAYNPYTEPSMEIFSYHEGLGKWVEVGNSGLFRPEMLLPMGFPDNVKVIGYGLSLERPTMIKYGIDNIRDLVGHKVNLQMVQDNPICRLDKSSHSDHKMRLQQLECRQEKILSSLDKLCTELDRLKSNKKPIFSITANEKKPTLSLLILTELYKHKIHFINPRKQVENFLNTESNDRTEISMRWENVPDIYLSSNKTKIEGEVDVIRFLARQMTPSYESDAVMATYIDQWLDLIHTSVLHGNNKERAAVLRLLNSHLGANKWLGGNEHSIADVVMWSALYQTQSIDTAPNHVKRWLINCSKLQCYKHAEEFVENVQINKQ